MSHRDREFSLGRHSDLRDRNRRIYREIRAGDILEDQFVREQTIHDLGLQFNDPKTGFLFGDGFEDALEETIPFAIETRRPLSVIILDGDHFKWINDRFGHDVGDEVIKVIAASIRDLKGSDLRRRILHGDSVLEAPEIDFVGRLGGDEFALALFENLQNAATLAQDFGLSATERVAQELPEVSRIFPKGFQVSTGTAEHLRRDIFGRFHPETAKQLIRRADQRMYAERRASRNTFNRILHFPYHVGDYFRQYRPRI